ncbi:MAG: LysR family transcriptional regulator [Sandaracinaceae bacterium]
MPRFDVGSLDLNHLLTFRVFVDEGTVSAAAVRLNRTQPAISARLRLLREALGVELVARSGRRLALTPTGRRVYAHACLIERQAETLLDEVRADQPMATLRIGVLPTIGVFAASKVIAQMRSESPSVRFELVSDLVPPLLAQLAAGELDLVVGVGRPPSREHRVIGRVQPVRVRCADRARATDAWVTYGTPDDDFFSAVEGYLTSADLMRHVVVRVSHIETLKRLVLEGVGSAILPDYTVSDPRFDTEPVPPLSLRQPVWVARRSELALPVLDQWIEALRQQFDTGA